MNDFRHGSVAAQGQTDLGLRSFMLGTYKYMIAAMAVAGIVAYGAGTQLIDANGNIAGWARMLYSGPGLLALVFGIPIAFGVVGAKLPSMSIGGARIFLFVFAAVMGVWLSAIAALKDPMISVRIFFMASAMFAGLSLIGYTTKKDLGMVGKISAMVFIGFVAINVLGFFFKAIAPTGMMDQVFNVIGLLAISGITAWETQGLKRIYYGTVGDPAMAEKYAVYGAAGLLLAFINIFSILMNLFGDS